MKEATLDSTRGLLRRLLAVATVGLLPNSQTTACQGTRVYDPVKTSFTRPPRSFNLGKNIGLLLTYVSNDAP
jgi:hypothetical protein